MQRIRHLYELIFLTLLFSSHCAVQVRPTGGPPDRTPPKIIKVTPENKATNVPLDQKVEFQFSESMNEKTLERAIFITPNPGERVKSKWKGDRLRIVFEDSLQENRTYVITLGTDLKDSHGNSLAQSYTLAFSTGDEISDGKISGQVYNEPGRGILIWAYILDGGKQPNPTQESGDYVTQTDNQGKYALTNLSEGLYRVFAIQDKDNNRFFEPGFDGLGVPQKDILLTKENLTVNNVNFRIAIRDTVGPGLSSVSAQDNSHLTLQFDEELLPAGIENTENYSIRAKKSETDTLGVRLPYLNELDKREIALVTAPQRAKTEYQTTVNRIMDLSHNLIDAEYNSAEFSGSALPDTFRPRLVKTVPTEGARNIFLDSKIEFYFSEAIQQNSFESQFRFQDSLSQDVPGKFDWSTPASVTFKPEPSLQSLTTYHITVALDSIFDLAGNAIADSTLRLPFTTINKDTLSSISGEIIDPDSNATGPIILKASQNITKGQTYQIQLPEPGPYAFNNILPGVYRIEGFRDHDENGEYSYGQASPFQPSERFVVYPDSLKVRARWPNEGNDITFPSY